MTRTLAILVAVLLLPLIALPGLALTYQATTTESSPVGGVVACDPGASATAAKAGCALPPPPGAADHVATARCVPDPSGTGGCVTPTLAHLHHQVEEAFGHLPAACWSARGGDPYSDHPKGRACDYTIGHIGTYPSPTDAAHGWRLAHWLQTNAAALHVSYIIWHGHIWNPHRANEGWRVYTGGGHYRSDGPTYAHYDHVHISTSN